MERLPTGVKTVDACEHTLVYTGEYYTQTILLQNKSLCECTLEGHPMINVVTMAAGIRTTCWRFHGTATGDLRQ